MNILMINKYFWKKGGSETVFFDTIKLLEEGGHSIAPFAMKNDRNHNTEYEEYFVSEVDYSKTGIVNKLISASKILYSFEAKKNIQKLLAVYSPDIAHFHIFQHQISPAVFGPLLDKNIPLILTLHDLKPICPIYTSYVDGKVCEACYGGKFINCLKNRCTKGSLLGSFVNTAEMYLHYSLQYYQKVSKYIAVSKFYKQKMVQAGFSEKNIEYLPNYIDAEKYRPVYRDDGYVLYFGRLSAEKGILTFLRSAERNSDIRHVIVGTGPLQHQLKSEAASLSLENVQFLGFMSGDDLKRVVANATCIVVPSEWYENCPMTILEAFAFGKPVIGASIGGIPELIADGVDGSTFEAGNIEALSEKIRWFWENRKKVMDMGREGRKKVEKKFNAERYYDSLMSIYHSAKGC